MPFTGFVGRYRYWVLGSRRRGRHSRRGNLGRSGRRGGRRAFLRDEADAKEQADNGDNRRYYCQAPGSRSSHAGPLPRMVSCYIRRRRPLSLPAADILIKTAFILLYFLL
jgi:hypothetical protein